MIVGILGSGGREHALCETLKKSKNIKKLYCFPEMLALREIATNINVDIENFEEIKNFILKENIDLIIVGPEKP